MRVVLLLLVCLLSGCLGSGMGTEVNSDTPTQSLEISDESAKVRALEHERSYVRDAIENHDEYGFGVGNAEVANRTANGVYVVVQYPYWYSSGDVEADGVSEARYVINETTIKRVDGTIWF